MTQGLLLGKEAGVPFIHLPIPVTGRERYTKTATPAVIVDSRGTKQVVWPISKDLPTQLVINISPHGHIESVDCVHPTEVGRTVVHFLSQQRFFVRIAADTGVISRFGYISPVLAGPDTYDSFLDLLNRMVDAAKMRTDDYVFKWKLIFSAEFILQEWKTAREPLTELLLNPFGH